MKCKTCGRILKTKLTKKDLEILLGGNWIQDCSSYHFLDQHLKHVQSMQTEKFNKTSECGDNGHVVLFFKHEEE